MLRHYLSVALIIVVGLGVVRYLMTDHEISAVELDKLYGGPPSQFLLLPSGMRVHYRDRAGPSGTPTVVLLHGSNASLHTWEPWATEFSGKLRLITMDLPGHGLTGATIEGDYSIAGMVAFVDSFTRELGLAGPIIIGGNSMGGNVAWHFAVAHPDRVAKLILIDSGGMSSPEADTIVTAAFRQIWDFIRRELQHFVPLRAVFEYGLRSAFYDQLLVTPEMTDRYWKLNLRPGTRRAASFNQPSDPEADELLHEIAQPTLILWGRDDQVIPVASAGRFKAALPDATLVIYNHCGHFPMEEVPARSAADVLAFVEK